jgi:hypothetical protein
MRLTSSKDGFDSFTTTGCANLLLSYCFFGRGGELALLRVFGGFEEIAGFWDIAVYFLFLSILLCRSLSNFLILF